MGEGSARDIVTTAATLFFILDPLGNIPTFHAVLANVPVRARRRVILRELFIALFVLVVFLVAGVRILGYLGLTQPSLGIAGGIMLFVIALRMVFPQAGQQDDAAIEDPFIVPLAVPLIAGPSAVAYILLLSSSGPGRVLEWLASLLIAWAASTLILTVSPTILAHMGDRALRAITRLMGMLLILVAVQMALDGLAQYLKDSLGIA